MTRPTATMAVTLQTATITRSTATMAVTCPDDALERDNGSDVPNRDDDMTDQTDREDALDPGEVTPYYYTTTWRYYNYFMYYLFRTKKSPGLPKFSPRKSYLGFNCRTFL